MKTKTDTTFLVDLFSSNYPLNITTTQAPIPDGNTKMLQINLDGTFYDVAGKTNHIKENVVYPHHDDSSVGNSQQIFIHESMLGSLFFGLNSQFFPLDINYTAVTSTLMTVFFEIKKHYGEQVATDIEITVMANDGNFISLNRTAGIEIGKKSPATLALMVYCANETTPRELAVEFSMNLKAVLNASLDNYYIYLNVPEIHVFDVQLINDHVGMFSRDYNTLISMIMTLVA